MKLSVVISAFNEEKNIGDCLESVREIADEIIVVDNESMDATVEIARKHNAKIYTQPNRLMLNTNKNFGIKKAISTWILNLDADERVSEELKSEILNVIKDDSKIVNGYSIPRKNIIFGKWIQNSIWWPDYHLRLFRKGTGSFAEKHVHEHIEVSGKVEKLESPIIHYNYTSISQYLQKLDKIYTENEVQKILDANQKLTTLDAIRMPVHDFLKTFFLQRGYRDGLHGLVLSLLQAFYAEIIFAKVWERQGFKVDNNAHFLKDITAEFRKLGHEFNYWLLYALIEESRKKSQKVLLKIKRKIAHMKFRNS
jgi:glycosyltransferase involved in cell wall biosynthesis